MRLRSARLILGGEDTAIQSDSKGAENTHPPVETQDASVSLHTNWAVVGLGFTGQRIHGLMTGGDKTILSDNTRVPRTPTGDCHRGVRGSSWREAPGPAIPR